MDEEYSNFGEFPTSKKSAEQDLPHDPPPFYIRPEGSASPQLVHSPRVRYPGNKAGSEASSPHRRSESQVSLFGGTPHYVRQIRKARADIGDLGRAHLMEDADKARIVDNPNDELIFGIHNMFSTFFDSFTLGDYEDIELLDEDFELIEMMQEHRGNDNFGHYGWKMIQYIQNQMAEGDLSFPNRTGSFGKLQFPQTFEVNMAHIKAFRTQLYNLILAHPADSVCEIDMVLRHKYYEIGRYIGGHSIVPSAFDASEAPKVRFFNKPDINSPRDLEPRHIDTLVGVRGVVIRCSDLIPEISLAAFRCTGRKRVGIDNYIPCDHEVYEQVIEGEVIEPQVCPECHGKRTYELWHTMCHFSSKQLIKVSELAQNVPQGEAPQTISVYAYDDLIDTVYPGDRVEISGEEWNGIFKASGVRLHPRLRNLNAVFRTHIDALHVRKDNTNRMPTLQSGNRAVGILRRGLDGNINDDSHTSGNFSFSREIIAKIIALSRDPDIYEKLTKSLAPSIYGREDIKKGLLCQLFGGSKRTGKKFGKFRSELHILLCGDPSTAKSQLLQYMHKLSPRGVFTNGKGSSSVGLTAAVSKDPDSREFVLESGALVLSDRGTCCIDEFDKMDESARAVLHEVMEQQTVTIAKAGIVATLNSRTAVLASANPIHSRYDRRKAVIENINLPPALFSRFDLIYLVLDTPDEGEDRTLAEVLCKSFGSANMNEGIGSSESSPINSTLLAQYISYCRAVCNPKLSKQASESIQLEYLKMRHQEGNGMRAPTASARQLEALIRISQSLAKMRLSAYVEKADAVEAARLMQIATFQSLIDPLTGRIDFDQVNLGKTLRERAIVDFLKTAILKLLAATSAFKDNLFLKVQESLSAQRELSFYKIERKIFEEVMQTLEADRKKCS